MGAMSRCLTAAAFDSGAGATHTYSGVRRQPAAQF